MSNNLPAWIVSLIDHLDEVTEIDINGLDDISAEDWDHMVTGEYITEIFDPYM